MGGLLKKPGDRPNGMPLSGMDRFRYRTRYFPDSGIIGTKAFVTRHYQAFKNHLTSKNEKRPKAIGASMASIH